MRSAAPALSLVLVFVPALAVSTTTLGIRISIGIRAPGRGRIIDPRGAGTRANDGVADGLRPEKLEILRPRAKDTRGWSIHGVPRLRERDRREDEVTDAQPRAFDG